MRCVALNRFMLMLALLPWCGCKHICDDTPAEVIEFFVPIEDPQTNILSWVGLVETGTLDESQGWTDVVIEVVLDRDSGVVHDANESIGCDARYTIDGTLMITTADGLLAESIPVEFEADAEPGTMFALVDLSNHNFAGALQLGPEWTAGGLEFYVSFDGGGSLEFAWLLSRSSYDFVAEEFVGGGLLAVIEPPD